MASRRIRVRLASILLMFVGSSLLIIKVDSMLSCLNSGKYAKYGKQQAYNGASYNGYGPDRANWYSQQPSASYYNPYASQNSHFYSNLMYPSGGYPMRRFWMSPKWQGGLKAWKSGGYQRPNFVQAPEYNSVQFAQPSTAIDVRMYPMDYGALASESGASDTWSVLPGYAANPIPLQQASANLLGSYESQIGPPSGYVNVKATTSPATSGSVLSSPIALGKAQQTVASIVEQYTPKSSSGASKMTTTNSLISSGGNNNR